MSEKEMAMRATEAIEEIVAFAVREELIEEEDRRYARNLLLDVMQMDAPAEGAKIPYELPVTLTAVLEELEDIAAARGIIEDTADERDRFGARLCGCVTPHPAMVRAKFDKLEHDDGPEAATNWFYHISCVSDYIRVDKIAKNMGFMQKTPAGELEITINLSKPEKDPRDIARALSAPKVSYPACMLCVENPGYAGRTGFPARFNHRVVPTKLDGSRWYIQYSPYAYYSEHCIVFNGRHVPMQITDGTFRRLFDFVEQYPHYFLGSNADLPIVGGSILTHDHFQGGRHTFPMDKAPVEMTFSTPIAGVEAAIVDWPMSCVRLTGKKREDVEKLANQMLDAWRAYSDESCGILAHTDAPHNTITPIARKIGENYRLDLVLRNNRTSEEHPMGIYHPHADLHHIKKENIGLIEVMGLFILPGRLLTELTELEGYITGEKSIEQRPDESDPMAKHFDWAREIAGKVGTSLSREQATEAIHEALGVKCARVLADAGVYKQTKEGREGFVRFLNSLGYKQTGR
ncbi:MAG: UDP-glucose--hexose-1-phosphate uridylyltransferase [Eubacteriales bacterium]|nr:UDP-glucose--hexose-1-phosphate uridylyltransferase [Eubacteriales bacterium]